MGQKSSQHCADCLSGKNFDFGSHDDEVAPLDNLVVRFDQAPVHPRSSGLPAGEDDEHLDKLSRPRADDEEEVLIAAGVFYRGQWKNGMREGRGTLRLEHDDKRVEYYEGDWVANVAEGEGEYLHADGSSYRGQWKNNQKGGYGQERWADNSSYEGQYKASRKHGQGTFTWPDGSRVAGMFENDVIHGHAVCAWLDGRVYEGSWKQNMIDGNGRFHWPDGRSYVGAYQNGMKHGLGEFRWPDGRRYKGQWESGVQHGLGSFTTGKGEVREGEWNRGARLYWLDNHGKPENASPRGSFSVMATGDETDQGSALLRALQSSQRDAEVEFAEAIRATMASENSVMETSTSSLNIKSSPRKVQDVRAA